MENIKSYLYLVLVITAVAGCHNPSVMQRVDGPVVVPGCDVGPAFPAQLVRTSARSDSLSGLILSAVDSAGSPVHNFLAALGIDSVSVWSHHVRGVAAQDLAALDSVPPGRYFAAFQLIGFVGHVFPITLTSGVSQVVRLTVQRQRVC
jgi:hypothetical protein